MILRSRGKRRPAFHGTHSILVRYTLNVNLCVRNVAPLWLHVSLYIDLTWWHISERFRFTAYLAPDKAGLAQDGFTYICSACQFNVTRETLALAKLVSDLVKDPKNAEDFGQFGDAIYLP